MFFRSSFLTSSKGIVPCSLASGSHRPVRSGRPDSRYSGHRDSGIVPCDTTPQLIYTDSGVLSTSISDRPLGRINAIVSLLRREGFEIALLLRFCCYKNVVELCEPMTDQNCLLRTFPDMTLGYLIAQRTYF